VSDIYISQSEFRPELIAGETEVLGLECPYCSKAAVYLAVMPLPGERLSTDMIIMNEFYNPKDGDEILCQHCGKYLPTWRLNIEAIKKYTVKKGD
jgi:hypothetical protein